MNMGSVRYRQGSNGILSVGVGRYAPIFASLRFPLRLTLKRVSTRSGAAGNYGAALIDAAFLFRATGGFRDTK